MTSWNKLLTQALGASGAGSGATILASQIGYTSALLDTGQNTTLSGFLTIPAGSLTYGDLLFIPYSFIAVTELSTFRLDMRFETIADGLGNLPLSASLTNEDEVFPVGGVISASVGRGVGAFSHSLMIFDGSTAGANPYFVVFNASSDLLIDVLIEPTVQPLDEIALAIDARVLKL